MIKEKVNPEVEFSNDPMMKELHKVQMRITQQIKNMNGKKLSNFFKEKSKKIFKDVKY